MDLSRIIKKFDDNLPEIAMGTLGAMLVSSGVVIAQATKNPNRMRKAVITHTVTVCVAEVVIIKALKLYRRDKNFIDKQVDEAKFWAIVSDQD